jgi:transitional endoplasmic reticulum ATPase
MTTDFLSLKVAEANSKDVGRGLGRMDPEDLERLAARVGDIVEIQGKKTTVAKVMPAFKELRGQGLIQIDGLIRSNAATGLGERVSVKKVTPHTANRIVLTPVGGRSALSRERDMAYMEKLLDGLPLMAGDRVRATLFGARFQDFIVESTLPKGVVVIHPETIIQIQEQKGEGARESRVSYEDIGGLGKAVHRIREMVELPMKYPEVFERLGIDPPKGVLLHGPPGTGKTLLARAVAHETEAYFTHITGPEIMGKFYGESEARLRAVFEDAQKHAPSIIFIDEIDAIAPKREEMGGEKQVERRVVAQLLSLMDGLEGRGKVIVIGASNIPQMLDPALRRPGRFDREIEIGIPDRTARLEILEIHTRGMPLEDDVKMERIGEITHGFTGADLAALCREAAMTALRRIIPRIEFDEAEVPYELLLGLKVNMDDFMSALKEVEPSAIREVFVEIPKVRWDDVGGLEEIKAKLKEAVAWPLEYAPLFSYAQLRPPKGILLHGAPGTGKTLLARALATEVGINFISIKGPQLLSKYVGESERGIREIFKKAKQASPCIIFLDEIDAIAPTRGIGGADSHVTERVVSQILTEIDGIEELKGVWILGATNRIDMVDPALLRPGRFDLVLELPLPDEKSRLEILKIHTHGRPIASDVDLARLAEGTENMVGAEIEALCRRAVMLAIRQFLQEKEVQKGNYSRLRVTQNHFEEAREE